MEMGNAWTTSAWEHTDPCCKTQVYCCSLLCTFVRTIAKRSLHASCSEHLWVEQYRRMRGVICVSYQTHTERRFAGSLLPEPEEISPDSRDAARRDGGLGTAEPMSGLKPCPALHQASPRFLTPAKYSQLSGCGSSTSSLITRN